MTHKPAVFIPLEHGHSGKARRAHELEGRLLGELMVSDCLPDVMKHIRRPDQFADHAHRVIFSAILAQGRDEEKTDPVTMTLKLASLGQLEEAGGQAYVLELVGSATGAGNGAAYAQAVAKSAATREARDQLERALVRIESEDVAAVLADLQSSVVSISDAELWPEPQPLAAKGLPESYPADALPGLVRAAVKEVAGFVKAPIAMVASSALAALSLAAQAHADVQRAEKLSGPVGLFLLTVADSGERKSTCDGFFSTAIKDYQEQQAEAAKPDIKNYDAAKGAWESRKGGLKERIKADTKAGKPTSEFERKLRDLEDEKPEAPRVPKLLRGDDTPENLAFVLSREWPSAGVLSSEAGLVLGAHGMGKDSIMRNLGLLNILWDGGALSIGRRTSESFTVHGARLTVALQVQEPTLRSFFDRSGGLARGTGFLARFLVAWPESTQGARPFTDPPASWPHLAAFNLRIAAILNQPAPINEDGSLTPSMMMLSPNAKAAWVAFHDEIESELASGGELYDVRDVASKSADNAVRLAALFQLFEHGMGGAVGLDCFESASRIAAWHLSESRRFFGELALPLELADAGRLDNWLTDHCRRGQTSQLATRDAQRLGPVRDKIKLDAALRVLEELDRVRVVRDDRRKSIAINPALLGVAT